MYIHSGHIQIEYHVQLIPFKRDNILTILTVLVLKE